MFRRFWKNLDLHGQNIALLADSRSWTYQQLAQAVNEQAERLGTGNKKLVFLAIERDAQSVICYLALLVAGHAVYLCNEIKWRLVEFYRPDIVLWQSKTQHPSSIENYRSASAIAGHNMLIRDEECDTLGDKLGLLLSTSGSTGTSKLVRLSRDNIAVATSQMCDTLQLTDADRAITSIPLDHVYGLSVLHSQLASGGAIMLTKKSALDKSFWEDVRDAKVTSFAGVPWTYKIMKDIGVEPDSFPALRKLHQSGAKMEPGIATWLCGTFVQRKVNLYFMYGQTEASGRISVLPFEFAQAKMGSVGLAVPGGKLECSEDGEIIYSGPNVMLGYAKCREDLCRGDDMNGVLHTGDLGMIDTDGCLYLTGRRSRFCKILGNRVDLDDIESFFPNSMAIGDDMLLTVYFTELPSEELYRRADVLASRLRIPRQFIALRYIEEFPRSVTGKIAHDKLHTAAANPIFRDNDGQKN